MARSEQPQGANMSGKVELEPWWNVALLRVSWVAVVLVCCAVVHQAVKAPASVLNLLKLRTEVPRTLLRFCGVWVAARLGMSVWHYFACNAGNVPYCYAFLEDLFISLQVSLVLLCEFVNAANSLLVLSLGLYVMLPSPITCWWLLVLSVLVVAYQIWAMCSLATDRAQKVGLLHINYAIVVQWLLCFFAFPPAAGHTWGEETSVLRDWQAVLHVAAAAAVAFLLARYTHREATPLPEKETQPTQEPPV